MAVYRYRPQVVRVPGSTPYARYADVRRLWRGGAITAGAAFAVAVAGFVFVRTVLDMPILGVTVYEGVSEPHVLVYGLLAGLGAVVATALMHMLLKGSARPFAYFRWIIGLGLVLVALLPVFASEDLPTGVATAAANLVIGGVVWLGVVLAARSALRD